MVLTLYWNGTKIERDATQHNTTPRPDTLLELRGGISTQGKGDVNLPPGGRRFGRKKEKKKERKEEGKLGGKGG